MCRERQTRERQNGFTLLETLVAFAIAGLALAVLFRGSIDALVAERMAGRMDEALAHARSRLAAACHGTRLFPGTTEGQDGGGFAWRTKVLLADSAVIPRSDSDQARPPLRGTLYAVEVTILWGGLGGGGAHPHQVSLATSCLDLRQAAPA